MKRNLLLLFSFALIAALTTVSSCKKTSDSQPLEPISLVKPDSAIVRRFAGDSLPVEIKFTTDRPLNYIQGLYDVAFTDTAGYTATYPDTLFFVPLDTLNPRQNLYTYSTLYRIPDTLPSYSVVRFKVSFEAGKNTFTTGQNYPQGKVSAYKEFRVDVR
jgi:hypothetical protein